MKSIALINGSKITHGIYRGINSYAEILNENGYSAKWYHCVDSRRTVDYDSRDNVVRGVDLRNEILSMGFNRLFTYPLKLRNLSEDIVFLGDPSLLNIARYHNNVILKLHDLRPFTEYRDNIWLTLLYKTTWKLAYDLSRIIVSTNHMKHQLSNLGIEADKIRVVMDTPDLKADTGHYEISIDRILKKRRVNLLYIAVDKPHKNIDFYIELARYFSKLEVGYDFHFRILSKLSSGRKKTQLYTTEIRNLEVYENINSIEQIYADSDVLIYPSLYEGFGRPIIEAMSFGIPVMTFSIQPFIEIGADSIILMETDKIKEWARKIIEITEPNSYTIWSKKSLHRGEFFSLKNYRDRLLSVFRDF